MSARKSAFATWFEAQHGKRTTKPMTSDGDLINRIKAGDDAHKELEHRREWDRRKSSALSAWCIADADKLKPRKW